MNSVSKKVKNVEIINAVLQIGRLPDNDIQIVDPRLSGKHCRIMRKLDQEGKMKVILEDTSSNGTHVNGKVVSIKEIG